MDLYVVGRGKSGGLTGTRGVGSRRRRDQAGKIGDTREKYDLVRVKFETDS